MIKYDASYPIQHIKVCLKLWLTSGDKSPDFYFIYGCLLDDRELATLAIRFATNTTKVWGSTIQAGVSTPACAADKSLLQAHIMDLSSWRISRFKRIPDDYKFAWMRATRGTPVTASGQMDWSTIADKFSLILDEIHGS
ncbi:uncharacterized protein L201_007319 [Kwoniella dendrophila CBS 6074]|uniref:Gamma-glutamylcyclotransferase AIG2-like domain-containing protein n=1 Tax=Kwoniella dendrophila CBS 6074 TaxID=1295534 RepID=A0AAX4K473_9TREE